MNNKREGQIHMMREWRESDRLRDLLSRYRQADQPTKRGALERAWLQMELVRLDPNATTSSM